MHHIKAAVAKPAIDELVRRSRPDRLQSHSNLPGFFYLFVMQVDGFYEVTRIAQDSAFGVEALVFAASNLVGVV
jgi:hypothetical protein